MINMEKKCITLAAQKEEIWEKRIELEKNRK